MPADEFGDDEVDEDEGDEDGLNEPAAIAKTVLPILLLPKQQT